MPQNPTSPSQIPGEDVLLDTLRRSKVTDEQRQQIWDAYHIQGDESAFTKSLNTLSIADDAKQTLYDMRYKGFKNQGNQATPTAPSTAAPSLQLGGASSIGPSKTGAEGTRFEGYAEIGKRVQNMFAPLMEHVRQGGAAQDPRLLAPEQLVGGPLAQSKHPIATATGEFAGGFTSGSSLALMAATGGIGSMGGAAGKIIPRLVSAGFGASMVKGAYDRYAPFKEAMDRGDADQALYHLTHGVLSGAMAAQMGQHALQGKPAAGPIEVGYKSGLEESPTDFKPTRGDITKLQSMGFTNQHISNMNADMMQAALRGDLKAPAPVNSDAPKPSRASVPAGDAPPTRPTEAVSGAKASAANQSAAAPVTSQVPSEIVKAEPKPQGPGGDFRGMTGPMRPYDPSGNRFAKGGTTGMEPLDLIAPTPNKDQGSARPQVDPITGTTQIGYKRETPTTIKGPSTVPGTDPLQMMLENRALFQTKPQSPYTASEKAATMSAPRPNLGPEFEAAQQQHDIERNKSILRDPRATEFDKQVAQSRLDEGIVAAQPKPINRGTVTGSPTEPVYPKAMPGPQIPVASVPEPKAIKPPVAVSYELPQAVHDGLDLMMKQKKLVEGASTEAVRKAAQARWEDIAKTTKGLLKYHLKTLTPEQRQTLLDDQLSKAGRHEQQAQAINDIISGDKLAKALREEMQGPREGQGEVGGYVGTKSQFSKTTGSPIRVIGTTHGDLRSAIHEMLGDRTAMHFDEIALDQRARARDQGLDPETVQPEGYRRLSHEEFQARKLEAKKMLGEIQETFKTRLKDIVADRLDKNPSLVQEQGEEATKTIHSQALKELLAEKNDKGLTIAEQIKELRELLGRDVQRPLYAKKGEPVVTPEGVVKGPGEIPSKSLEVARRIWGTKLNKIPDEAAWEAKANEFQERGRLHKAIAQGLKSILEAKPPKGKEDESGFIGDQGSGLSKDVKLPTIQEAVQNAIKEGLTVWTIGDDKPAGDRGWISSDGKRFIASESKRGMSDHDSLAWMSLGKPTVRGGQSQKAFLQAGWIRKESIGNYSTGNLNDSTIDAIELDMIRNHSTNNGVILDVWKPEGIKSIDIAAGWEDLKNSIKQELRRQRMSDVSQAGKIGGAELLTGATLGAVAGGVAGHVLGGVHGSVAGAVMGYSLGFLAPAILQSRPVIQAMKTMANVVRGAGLTLKQWFQGVPQKGMTGVDPDMDKILREQIAHADRSVKWIERAKQLPATIYRGVDPFAYVADKKNMSMIGRVMMSMDPKGRVFRDLTVPDTQSLYMSLANAGGDALGQRRFQNMSYNDVKADANKAGLREMLDRFLNLKAYQRVNEVLQEHIQTLDGQIQNLQTKLQSPSITVRQTVALQDDLKEATKMRKDIEDRVQQGKATPRGYTPQKIQASLAQMQQVLSPQEYASVEQLAKRAFQAREHILDLLFDSGIIGQDAYTTYKQRGPEYIPMERIMDDLENNRFQSSTTPLHLRHQSVIQTLEGSERTNVNPWEAFDHADRKAFNQLYRNDAMKSALDLASAYPNTIGQEFTLVKPDYQPKAGEAILGHYENGQPKLYAVPKYLGDTMQQAPLAMKTGLSVFANWFGHVYKKAATIGSAGFQVSSALAHALSGMMIAPHGASPMPTEVIKFINDWRKAAKDVINQGQFVRELTRYGGASGSFQSKVDPEYFANPSELGFRGKLAKGQILEAAQDLAISVENINRTNIFMRARQAGMTAKAAAWEAKQFAGMPDFSRLGDISRPLNHIFMFYNAANQYLHQATSAIRKNPERVFAWMATMTAMTIALSSWNLQQVDSKGNNLLRKETTFDRQRNWIVELPWTYFTHAGAEKGFAVKVPKPFIARLLNPVEDVFNYAVGKEARTGQQQAIDSISNVSPIHLNLKADDLGRSAVQSGVSALHPLVKFGVQQFSNVDDYGRPIVPGSQQGIAPEFQEGPYTSAVAQRMGEGGFRGAVAGGSLGASLGGMTGYPGAAVGAVIGAGVGAEGVSPRRIDVGVRSLTAGVGSQTESLLDPFFGGTESKRQLSGMERFRQAPLMGPIVSRFTTSPSDAEFEALSERFYTAFQQADTIKKTSDYLLSQGKGTEAARYIQDHKNELHQAMVLSRLLEPITSLNKLIREIQGSPEANTESSRNALAQVYEVRMNLLRAAKDMLDAVPSKASDTGPMGNVISNTSPSK